MTWDRQVEVFERLHAGWFVLLVIVCWTSGSELSTVIEENLWRFVVPGIKILQRGALVAPKLYVEKGAAEHVAGID